jgi:hypothetical protein
MTPDALPFLPSSALTASRPSAGSNPAIPEFASLVRHWHKDRRVKDKGSVKIGQGMTYYTAKADRTFP